MRYAEEKHSHKLEEHRHCGKCGNLMEKIVDSCYVYWYVYLCKLCRIISIDDFTKEDRIIRNKQIDLEEIVNKKDLTQ